MDAAKLTNCCLLDKRRCHGCFVSEDEEKPTDKNDYVQKSLAEGAVIALYISSWLPNHSMGDTFHSLADPEENTVLKQKMGGAQLPRRIGRKPGSIVLQIRSKASIQELEKHKDDHEAYDCKPDVQAERGEKEGAAHRLCGVVDMGDDANIVVEEGG
eukprot:GFKZ01007271.1.p4 GENE.GFKZ01007271.1~~GFKZ01007271.1.p4  ORF type:complete len:157 (+),score=30.06 GFKZ01007271.1:152-622(+)